MIKFKCLVNGAIAPGQRERVEREFAQIYRERFGAAVPGVQVEFTEIAPGMWFTGGRLSRAAMVLGSVPPGTSQALRVELMDALAHSFSAATGAPYHDVMVVAADPRERA